MGVLHPDYLLRQLTSRQLAEWEAFFKLKPFGDDVTHRLIARGIALYYNRTRAQAHDPLKEDDILPAFTVEEQDPELMKATLRAYLK